jgi:hypothetical protein
VRWVTPRRWRRTAALQYDARSLRAWSEAIVSGSGASPGLRLLALRLKPMIDEALRSV